MAKSALNQQTKTLTLDFQRAGVPVMTAAIAPRFIRTRLTGFRRVVDIEESSNGMYDIIFKLALG
jgi:hypothetical protein